MTILTKKEFPAARAVLISLLMIINGLIFYNCLSHDPGIGYDARGHLDYIKTLAEFRLPGRSDSIEFFSPPLAYLLPGLLMASGLFSFPTVAKLAQVINALFFLGLSAWLLKTCQIIRPGNYRFKILALLMVGMIPIYYKSFSFVRSEPLIAFLAVLTVHRFLLLLFSPPKMSNSLLLGFLFGGLILTNRSGLFIILGLVVVTGIAAWKEKEKRSRLVKTFAFVLIVAFLTGGWFYISLYLRYGSINPFPVTRCSTFSFSNQPREFYLDLGLGKLFTDPVRPSFPNRLIPILYSETWGDYWGFFTVYAINTRTSRSLDGWQIENYLDRNPGGEGLKTNRFRINRYLGRVNAAALFPTALLAGGFVLGAGFLAGLIAGRGIARTAVLYSLSFLTWLLLFAGYLWFLLTHPSFGTGATIKAVYLLPSFPFLAWLTAELLIRIRRWNVLIYRLACIFLILVFLHNLPTSLTRHTSRQSWLYASGAPPDGGRRRR